MMAQAMRFKQHLGHLYKYYFHYLSLGIFKHRKEFLQCLFLQSISVLLQMSSIVYSIEVIVVVGGGDSYFIPDSVKDLEMFTLLSCVFIALMMLLSELSNYTSKVISVKVLDDYTRYSYTKRMSNVSNNQTHIAKKELIKCSNSCGTSLFLVIQLLTPLIKSIFIGIYLLLFYFTIALLCFISILFGGYFFYKANLETIRSSDSLFKKNKINDFVKNKKTKFLSRYKFSFIFNFVLSLVLGVIIYYCLSLLERNQITLTEVFIIIALIKIFVSSAGGVFKYIGLINNHYPQIKMYYENGK